MVTNKLLGSKARKARELKNYSRSYVSDKVGMCSMSLYRKEAGERPIHLLEAIKLAKLYKLPFESIFLDEGITNL